MQFEIGVCVQYSEGIYNLAKIAFKSNEDIVWYVPTGDLHMLGNGEKYAPHITYHGTAGIHHSVAYGEHYGRGKIQGLKSFHGTENLVTTSFGRNDAKALGHVCKCKELHIVIDVNNIELKSDTISDHIGTVTIPLPTTSYRVDLIEPGRIDLVNKIMVINPETINHKLFKEPSPWCLITVFKN